MNLTEWLKQFFEPIFSAEAENNQKCENLDDTWPHGHSWDPLGLYTYEEKEQTMEERLVQVNACSINPTRELLPVTWPDGTAWNSLKPFWVEGTGKTYETLDEAVDDMGGKMPSHASFGALKFEA